MIDNIKYHCSSNHDVDNTDDSSELVENPDVHLWHFTLKTRCHVTTQPDQSMKYAFKLV